MKKDAWKEYFAFSKKERVALTIIIAMILIFVVLPFFYSPKREKILIDTNWKPQMVALETSNPDKNNILPKNPDTSFFQENKTPQSVLFFFDPNTLDEEGWKKLGLKNKTIKTIINYRQKGGQFRKPEDIRKLYGLSKAEADRLVAYVKIAQAPGRTLSENITSEQAFQSSKAERSKIKSIDVNKASEEEWKSLPGIGPVLSNRIIKFRNSIKGFQSIDQVKKTYGLSDSVFNNILPFLTISSEKEKKDTLAE